MPRVEFDGSPTIEKDRKSTGPVRRNARCLSNSVRNFRFKITRVFVKHRGDGLETFPSCQQLCPKITGT